MNITPIDIAIIVGVLLLFLAIGIYSSKSSGKNASSFFLTNSSLPWYFLGISMVATTFAADTPLFVTQIVRESGVASNWMWWALLIGSCLTVFIYSQLWRRLGITTDLEFYRLRYDPKKGGIIRGFRAVYLGLFFNAVIIGQVTLAAMKLGSILFGVDPWIVVVFGTGTALIYSLIGGFKGVVLTDVIQFLIAMGGSIAAAIYLINLPEVGGIDALLEHPEVSSKLDFFPDSNNTDNWWSLFLIPLFVTWWSSWYPGAEPGGGGYIAQRMLAAKNENESMYATLFFNVAHYAIRPWPWILVALASIVLFPDLASIKNELLGGQESMLGEDLAYAMALKKLPPVLIGIVMVSLISAYLSTISTHLNWGASYLVNDFYKLLKKEEDTQNQGKKEVVLARLFTFIIALIGIGLALILDTVKDGFFLLLTIGAGTGLIYLLRWFWGRINAWTEIAAMISSFVFAITFHLIDLKSILAEQLPNVGPGVLDFLPVMIAMGGTTIVWLIVTFSTAPVSVEIWENFKQKAFGSGKKLNHVKLRLLASIALAGGIYSLLFLTGYAIMGFNKGIIICAALTTLCFGFIGFNWKKMVE